MKKIEILGADLDEAIKELGIEAIKTFQGADKKICPEALQVWELSEDEFDKLNDTPDSEWKNNFGWFRQTNSSNICHYDTKTFIINDKEIKAYIVRLKGEEDEDIEYSYLTEYLEYEVGITSEKNVCAVVMDLAKINNMTMAELFEKYQG